VARRTRTETTHEMSTRRVEELATEFATAAADDESFSSSSFPPSSEEVDPFVFATTEASSCWSSPPSSGEEEDEGDNEGIVSFSSFRNHSVGNPGNGGGNVTLFRISVAKLPEVKSQL